MRDLQLQRPFSLHRSQGTSYPAQKKVGTPPQALPGHLPARASRCASDIGGRGSQPGPLPPRQQPLLRPPIPGRACYTATAGRAARSPGSQGPRDPHALPPKLSGHGRPAPARAPRVRPRGNAARGASGRPGLLETLKRGAGPYLSRRDPPLRVTLHPVHCGGREWPFKRGCPCPTWLARAELARANQAPWETPNDPPPP